MIQYKNISNKSPVDSYHIDNEYIIVKFKAKSKSGYDTYKYSYINPGKDVVERMKYLAEQGSGLATLISKEAHYLFESKS